MPTLLQIAPAVVTLLLMFTVGLSIGARDLRQALARPGLLVLLVGLQVALIPPLGVGLARLVADSSAHGRDAALWIVLLASCPGGAISNALVLYGRGDVAMSVLMTAATSLLAAITMPLVLLALNATGLTTPLEVPGTTLFAQSIVLLMLPCVLGMSVRRWRRGEVARLTRACGRLGGAMLVGTLAIAMIEHRASLVSVWPVAVVAATLFVAGAGTLGWVIALATRLEGARRFTVIVEFAVRNIAAAFAISVLSFGREDFAAFGAVYLVAEVLLIAGVAASRRHPASRAISGG